MYNRISLIYIGMLFKNIKLGTRAIRKMNYTRMVSLPKVWLENVELEVRDLIEMEMNEKGELILRKVVNENA